MNEVELESNMWVKVGRFLRRAWDRFWPKGFTIIFQTKQVSPGDPVTGEGRESKTSIGIRPGAFEGDDVVLGQGEQEEDDDSYQDSYL